MKKLISMAAMAVALAAGGVAIAQGQAEKAPPPRHMMGDTDGDGKVTKAELTAALQARFAKMDLNGDGKVTKEERDQAREQRFDERFARMDTDKNGQISKAEMKAAHEARAEDGKGKRGHRWGGRGHGRHGGPGMGGGMMDTDKDGTLTREAFMARPIAMFDKADANKDGVVTAEEMKVARPMGGKRWGRPGPEGDAPPPPPPAN